MLYACYVHLCECYDWQHVQRDAACYIAKSDVTVPSYIYLYTFVSSFDVLVVCLFVVCLLICLFFRFVDDATAAPTPAVSLYSTLCSWSCFQLLDRCFQCLIQSNRLHWCYRPVFRSHCELLSVLLQGVPHSKYPAKFGRASVPLKERCVLY